MPALVTMVMSATTPHLPMCTETQHRLFQTLQAQHQKLVEAERPSPSTCESLNCHLLRCGDSYCFVNDLWREPKAFASTAVVLRHPGGNTVKSVVQLKRNARGDAMASITIKGPAYKLVDGVAPPTSALLAHASAVLFLVYARALYQVKGTDNVPPLPPVPPLPEGVRDVKFHDKDAVQQLVARLSSAAVQSSERSPMAVPASPPAPLLPPGTSEPQGCYICWRQVTCDILFPCMVASHACCHKCALKLYERWRCLEYQGEVTVPCPMCNRQDGVLVHRDGRQLRLPNKRYSLRRQAKPSYRRTRVFE